MNPIFEKLAGLLKQCIPHDKEYIGFFEPKENFNKLVAYAKQSEGGLKFLWIHRDHRK